jgi:hypothetical protein
MGESQPYPPPYPYSYAQPSQPYAAPQPTYVAGPSHFHDGEVIADFMAVGTLAAVDLLVRQSVDANVGTLVVVAGLAGGGGAGYLLSQHFPIDAGAAHATTFGLLLGLTNGALLVEPTGYSNGSSIMGLLTAGSVLGAGGGFAYGQLAHLTGPQATFAANVAVLGITTAALGSVTGSTNSKFGGWEDATLAIGLDGGALAGLLIAPHLDWSSHRANIVFLSTFVGARRWTGRRRGREPEHVGEHDEQRRRCRGVDRGVVGWVRARDLADARLVVAGPAGRAAPAAGPRIARHDADVDAVGRRTRRDGCDGRRALLGSCSAKLP